MGRKRWWREGLELLVLFILSHSVLDCHCDGNVGCLFSKHLCNYRTETCYNDLAFGKCIPLYADLDAEDLYQYNLDTEELELLRLLLQKLEGEGYKWPHSYTQCIMQTSLYNFRHGLEQDFRLCHHLKDNDENRFHSRHDIENEEIQATLKNEPRNILVDNLYFLPDIQDTYMKLVPQDKIYAYPYLGSTSNPGRLTYGDKYLSNLYENYEILPSQEDLYLPERRIRKKSLSPSDTGQYQYQHQYQYQYRPISRQYDSQEEENSNSNSIPLEEGILSDQKSWDSKENADILSEGILEFLPEEEEKIEKIDPFDRNVDPFERDSFDRDPEDAFEKDDDPDTSGERDDEDGYERIFSRKYKHPKRLSTLEFLYENEENGKKSQKRENDARNDQEEEEDKEEDKEEKEESERSLVNNDNNSNENGIYTEGGFVQPLGESFSDVEKDGNPYGVWSLDDDLDALLWRRELAGFKRRERLDVKKPGPLFSTNNFAFKTQSPPAAEDDNLSEENQQNDNLLTPLVKKLYTGAQNANEMAENLKIYLDHVYVEFELQTDTLTELALIIKELTKMIGLESEAVEDLRITRNGIVFQVGPNKNNYNAVDVANKIDDVRDELRETLGVDIVCAAVGDKDNIILSPAIKKNLDSVSEMESTMKPYTNVDLDHVYIEFREDIHAWSEGEHIVKEANKLLGLKPGTFGDIRVTRAGVTFKVAHNDQNYNASDVVNRIDGIRGKIKEIFGKEVISAGIGDKARLPPTLEVANEVQMNSSLFGALVAAGVAAAIAAAVVTLIIARRHAKSRAKLAGLATPDPEASKDYQDLCRARMQAKQPTSQSEKVESPRLMNLAREGENITPSNRSSTSSWSEEPTLSNMDISTGHMVLSYMEDHLKNKDRLDQEWAALCAYEADPSSTEIAECEINSKYNRPGAALPYDHSRVVLNDLSNANNCDYINASTITDHDPRNPAYIATQGPLPQTTADFWQLIWEQGSVVVVMLTRLTEEGQAMCHRYWPEEGSELYHIYEVHLVSEHFWCDDYLVRSFYLKNLRTGETRTVTQFHFLSWPENGVPQSTKALLEFRRKVNKSYRGRSCPIVVHCSDGAGRTGTYCLIDMVLNRMAKGAKEIDIAATLEHIRDQRADMVATKEQFEFVLMAVAEEVHAILKALPATAPEKATPGGSSSSQSKPDE